MPISLPTVHALSEIRIAAPCPASWDEMRGDDRVRFCEPCRKNVYNLSEMTAAEAVESVNRHEGRPCVRFFLRRDGTAITSDCQVGLRWVLWKQLRKRMALAAAFFAWLFLPACGGGNMVRPKLLEHKDRMIENPKKNENGEFDSVGEPSQRDPAAGRQGTK